MLFDIGSESNSPIDKKQLALFKRNRKSVKTDIVLGRPSKNCAHYGICRILPFESLENCAKNISSKHVSALLYFNKKEKLVILFDKSEMSKEIKKKHFSKLDFKLIESLVIPPFASDSLGRTYTLFAGLYKLKKKWNYYKIEF